MRSCFSHRFTLAIWLAAVSVGLATPALAGGPLLFEWSGVDGNDDPFNISMTVTNVQNGESGFNVNDFDATGLFTTTETTTQKLVVTNVTGDIFGGSYTLPTANSDDPYQFVETQNDNGNTVIGIFAGADSSNIGLTFNGQLVNWVIFESTANLPYVDPSTATSFADLFPVGTYSLTGQTGQSFTGDLTYNDFNSDLDLIPNSLTISVIPEPTSVGLAMLGLGGLALLRRRGNA